MSEVRVDFGALSGGAQGILSTYRALQGSLENLEQQLGPMVSTWTGEAREAYFVQKGKWEQASASMAGILQQMGQAVDTAHGNYQSAENSNKSLWG